MCYGINSVLIFLFFLTFTYNCLKITPERASVTFVNETYLSNVILTIRRTSRGGAYVANLDFVTNADIGYNTSVHLIFYEYLHNEFRRSFVEMHFKTCDLIHKDPYFGSILRNGGMTKCPLPLGKTSMKNISLNCDIPSVCPFEKGKGELTVLDDVNKVVIVKGEIVMTFKQK